MISRTRQLRVRLTEGPAGGQHFEMQPYTWDVGYLSVVVPGWFHVYRREKYHLSAPGDTWWIWRYVFSSSTEQNGVRWETENAPDLGS